MVYLYESHVGGLYINEECLNFEDLYCEECGDSDNLLGSFETLKEFWDLVKDECDINGSGGFRCHICIQSLLRNSVFHMKLLTRTTMLGTVDTAVTVTKRFSEILKMR